jgi:sporulation protein YlmC with PRC-barrel domain
MLKRLRDFEKWEVCSMTGETLGTIEDVYFDDQQWAVRYLVVRTGNWMTGRSVLLSPFAVARVESEHARLEVQLTPEQIRNAPDADLAKPISRRWEAEYSKYYGYPYYWAGSGVWGIGATPALAAFPPPDVPVEDALTEEERHLRSAAEVSGYHVEATDGEIGHVEDFLVDDSTWAIRYLMIDTSNWIGGRTVLIAPAWADRIEWPRRKVDVGVTRDEVKNSPEYDPTTPIDRHYEDRLAESLRRANSPTAARPDR